LGLVGTALGRPERLPVAAVAYQSAVEPRPYRQSHSLQAAAARLKDRMTCGALDLSNCDIAA
jgi:HD-GYP domain-containing protein (c-di-GMP phosphodiesterase class II)